MLSTKQDLSMIRHLTSFHLIASSKLEANSVKLFLLDKSTLEELASLSVTHPFLSNIKHIRTFQARLCLTPFMLYDVRLVWVCFQIKSSLHVGKCFDLGEQLACMLVSHLHDDTWVVCGAHSNMWTIRIIFPALLHN